MSSFCRVPQKPRPRFVEEFARWKALEAERLGILDGMHQEHDTTARYREIEREQAALRAKMGDWFGILTLDDDPKTRTFCVYG